ncbi:MAG TPA: hypothetical protein VET87_12300 [Rubrivivax sp.]|jgi:hypothetical protein|nr:hypothetical protein [Rubrivivax sp.]
MAGHIASECQMIGISSLDDGIKAATSLDRLSSLDPKQFQSSPPTNNNPSRKADVEPHIGPAP